MKKIIAILAMIALVGGVAFAEAAVSGHVIGTVNVLESGHVNKDGDDAIGGSAGMNRIRIEAQGSDEDGKFGAWVRAEEGSFAGNAWWKPIDQFLMRIGSNGGDGYYEKAGVTTWMFYQTASDTGVVDPGNAWWSTYTGEFHFRNAFYGGFGAEGLMLEIKPVEMFGLNVVLPYFTAPGELADVFGGLTIQADVNLDFGNIALTYTGDASDNTNGNVYLYVGIGAIENVALDIGLGLTLAGDVEGHPIAVGLGAKVDISETIGLKARVTASLGGDKEKEAGNYGATQILADILPYFTINDSMTAFVSVGLAMVQPDEGDAAIGFHFNPYLQVGSEWGPKFLVGVKVWQGLAVDGKDSSGEDVKINWAVPIALNVSF